MEIIAGLLGAFLEAATTSTKQKKDESESEKAVARLVSGKGIAPPSGGPGEPR